MDRKACSFCTSPPPLPPPLAAACRQGGAAPPLSDSRSASPRGVGRGRQPPGIAPTRTGHSPVGQLLGAALWESGACPATPADAPHQILQGGRGGSLWVRAREGASLGAPAGAPEAGSRSMDARPGDLGLLRLPPRALSACGGLPATLPPLGRRRRHGGWGAPAALLSASSAFTRLTRCLISAREPARAAFHAGASSPAASGVHLLLYQIEATKTETGSTLRAADRPSAACRRLPPAAARGRGGLPAMDAGALSFDCIVCAAFVCTPNFA